MIGSHMIATTQYFPRDLYKQLSVFAKAQKKSSAQVVREAVEEKVIQDMQSQGNAKRFFEGLKGIQFKGGPKDLAKNHDKYLWDEYDC